MNIRIEKQTIRFRISSAEHALLLSGKTLTEQTTLPGNTELTFSITPAQAATALQLETTGLALNLNISQQALQELTSPLPKRSGIEIFQSIGDDSISVSLEVDTKSRHR